MKFQILFFALFLAFSPFMQAQDAPSEAEKKAVFNYIKKYNELENLVNNEVLEFNQLAITHEGKESEKIAAQKVHATNINEAIKNFTAIPAPSACKEIRLKMLTRINCSKTIVNKTVNNVYEKQANKEMQCTDCKAAKLLIFKLKKIDAECLSSELRIEMDKMLGDLASKYDFGQLDNTEQHKKAAIFNNGQAYAVELLFIISYFTDAHKEVLDVLNNTITNRNETEALAKAIAKYQAECAEGSKLLLAYPDNYNGDGSLYKVGQELAKFTTNYSQKTLPAMLEVFKKPNLTTAEQNIVKNGISEYSKLNSLLDKTNTAIYAFMNKLLEASK